MRKDEVINFLLSGGVPESEGRLRVLLSTVSGVTATKPVLIRFFNDDVDAVDIITTKSFQLVRNMGNPEPIICESEIGTFGNSVGLRNPGMTIALSELKNLRDKKALDKILNVSLSASNPQDFIQLVEAFSEVADLLELNFSCPHAADGFGSSIGCKLEVAENYVKEIKKALPNCPVPIFVKLTPNVSNIGAIAAACVKAGADGIVAINTVGPELYIEPNAQKPILNNSLGGKGGKSGLAVFEKALSTVREIRAEVGANVPIIGMGGVATGKQVAEMLEAGANVVGVGSALARVRQKNWAKYFSALKREATEILECGSSSEMLSESLLAKTFRMRYTEHCVKKIVYEGDVAILELDGEMDFKAGEFVFLWLPEIGEKPFSIALSKPLTFMVKKRGKVTDAIFNLKVGDKIYLRGLYGDGMQLPATKNAVLLAGGTGVAVLPKLAESLSAENIAFKTFVGVADTCESGFEVSHKAKNSIEKALAKAGEYTRVADNGIVGRVLSVLESEIKNSDLSQMTFYIVGPTKFFNKAAEMLSRLGADEKSIYISLEKMTRCGVGLCGECNCGKKLTCQYGSFVTYDEYKIANIEI
ncbi:MAG: dihydroorotate dehydrogenase [Treponemataceae bacterium]